MADENILGGNSDGLNVDPAFNLFTSWLYNAKAPGEAGLPGEKNAAVKKIEEDVTKFAKSKESRYMAEDLFEKISPTDSAYTREQAHLDVVYKEMDRLYREVLEEKYLLTDWEIAAMQADYFKERNYPVPRELEHNLIDNQSYRAETEKFYWDNLRADASLKNAMRDLASDDVSKHYEAVEKLWKASGGNRESILESTKLLARDTRGIIEKSDVAKIHERFNKMVLQKVKV